MSTDKPTADLVQPSAKARYVVIFVGDGSLRDVARQMAETAEYLDANPPVEPTAD